MTAITLPEPNFLPDAQLPSFLQMIELRSTQRRYSDARLSLQQLSFLLWCTAGLKMEAAGKQMRNVPSAGAFHPVETWLLVNRVEAVPPGLYRFDTRQHALEPRDGADVAAIAGCFYSQRVVSTSAVTFLWVANVERPLPKFGQRSHRYVLLDAGHICQNLYLAGQAQGLGVCALGAFRDDDLNALLGADGDSRYAVYAGAVGVPQRDLV